MYKFLFKIAYTDDSGKIRTLNAVSIGEKSSDALGMIEIPGEVLNTEIRKCVPINIDGLPKESKKHQLEVTEDNAVRYLSAVKHYFDTLLKWANRYGFADLKFKMCVARHSKNLSEMIEYFKRASALKH